jgi:hypothetical protein
MAWMDLDSGSRSCRSYEVYEDGLFNYKAAFETFVTVQDKAESAKLAPMPRTCPTWREPADRGEIQELQS